MKRKSVLFLTLMLTASLLAACGKAPKDESNDNNAPDQNTENTKDTENKEEGGNGTDAKEPLAEGALQTGVGIVTSLAASADASAEAEGTGQADVTIAAVTVDAEGRIVECSIDGAQTKVAFSAQGKITTDLKTEFQTKQESGADYGMKQASGIGKEWYEEADAFAAYCVGKTAEEVTKIAVNEKGAPSDTDLAASVTVSVGDFQKAVAKAVKSAADLGAVSGDKLGLGVITSISNSVDAVGDKDGEAQPYSTVTAVTVNKDGVITSSVIDAVQPKINFSAAGKITSDINAEVSSKDELGDDYGMKSASGIGREWNEQAAAYASYAAGKTMDEVNAVKLNEGAPADTDLAASVTIHVTDFNAALSKAVANAK